MTNNIAIIFAAAIPCIISSCSPSPGLISINNTGKQPIEEVVVYINDENDKVRFGNINASASKTLPFGVRNDGHYRLEYSLLNERINTECCYITPGPLFTYCTFTIDGTNVYVEADGGPVHKIHP